jgi:hypothetical protein
MKDDWQTYNLNVIDWRQYHQLVGSTSGTSKLIKEILEQLMDLNLVVFQPIR